jgi:hypothetical protein
MTTQVGTQMITCMHVDILEALYGSRAIVGTEFSPLPWIFL